MKVAPIMRALSTNPLFEPRLIHTGQHYDERLSQIFFEELEIPRPDQFLEVGSASHAVQTAEIMRCIEPVLEREQPQVMLVVGDVNSTIGCALVAAKFFLKQSFSWRGQSRNRPVIVHVEAGLRSEDRDMPEEINRVLTDSISDLLYVSDPAGLDNLQQEGVAGERIAFVGNVMIDTLLRAKERALESPALEDLELQEGRFALVTLHRPSNVDDPEMLRYLLATLDEVGREYPLVFPVHPRTRQRFERWNITFDDARWKLIEPQGYLDFMRLLAASAMVFTDSGGIQEETTVLGVPCITLRENTERPVTIEQGTNFLAGTEKQKIMTGYQMARDGKLVGRVPEFWDGHSAQRIIDHLADTFTVSG